MQVRDYIEISTDELIKYYQFIYKKRFAIDSDEVIDKNVVFKVIDKIYSSIENYQSTIDILKKAIIWYLYQHDNTTADGKKIPFQFRILLEQNWLLRSCIESTHSIDLALLLKAQETGISGKDLSRAMRRGDIVVMTNDSDTPQLLEKTLMRIEDLIEKHKLDGRALKKHNKLENLYTSEMPNKEYIKKAIQFIEKFEANFDK